MYASHCSAKAIWAGIYKSHWSLCRISCLTVWPALWPVLLTPCDMHDVLSDDLPEKLCNYVFMELSVISLTLENKEFGHGGDLELRFPLKSSEYCVPHKLLICEAAEGLCWKSVKHFNHDLDAELMKRRPHSTLAYPIKACSSESNSSLVRIYPTSHKMKHLISHAFWDSLII